MTDRLEATVVHAYGLVYRDTSFELPEAGIDGSGLSLVAIHRLAALVGELSAARYGAAAWREHAEDPRWLGKVVREHHEVLEATAEQTDVLPLRLPGIYQDVEELKQVLAEQEEACEEALSVIRGHLEWGAKIFLMGEAADAADQPAPASGGEYLRRRSAEASNREASRGRRQALVLDVHERLSQSAASAASNAPQDRALSGRREPMLLNAAYLLPRGREGGFLELADELNQRLIAEGMALETTGPWPAYNFAQLPDAAQVGGHDG